MRNRIILILLLNAFMASSQIVEYRGVVIDSATSSPLPFVNIVYNKANEGTTTNIDGKFRIKDDNVEFLKFSYLGFYTKKVELKNLQNTQKLIVSLSEKAYNIDEVVVLPGLNPAHRIIKKAVSHRHINNPENLKSFEYISYNKLYFTIDLNSDNSKFDTIKITDSLYNNLLKRESDSISKKDTALKDKANRFVEKQHFFIMETVSERKYKSPDKNREEVLGTKVSGLKNPSFMVLATQLQSLSFYKDLINIGDKSYLNPIAKGAVKKYFYLLEDTMFTKANDTIFIISFRPYKGKNFEGLKGVLQINTNNYAVQNVIAEPYQQSGLMKIKIMQKYDMINGIQWFPVELHTDILMPTLKAEAVPDTNIINDSTALIVSNSWPFKGVGKTYLQNIQINPNVNDIKFNNIEVDVTKNAHKKDSIFWYKYRQDSLSPQDIETYHVVDSIGEANNLDLKLWTLENLAGGYIPWKIFNIDYKSILNFNNYEGFRTGIGLITNDKLSEKFSIGGYFAYGFKDKQWKYGGIANLIISKKNDVKLSFNYVNDVNEVGGYSFFEEASFTSSESYRPFLVENMFENEYLKIVMELRIFRYLKAQPFIKKGRFTNFNSYVYLTENMHYTKYNYMEYGIKLKYAYKEKFFETPRGKKISMGTNYPVVWFNLISGNTIDKDYYKLEGKISKTIRIKLLGKSNFSLTAAYINKNMPLQLLYNGHGSYRSQFGLESANSFATMEMNEFVNKQFVSFYYSHDFGELLFKTKYFKPSFVVCNHIGWGTAGDLSKHKYFPVKSMEKGFYEAGLLINNIYNQSIIGYGFGVFYRYGPYQNPVLKDNFAYKITMTINL